MAPLVVKCCISVVRWTPVVFITAVILWSYYAYVVEMCLSTVDNIAEKVIYLVVYHPLIFVFLWSYWKTIFADPGSVPKEFYLSSQDREKFGKAENEETQKAILEKHGRGLPVQCRTSAGTYRFCEKCHCIKPDRAHHCSVCGSCVLKMDHHCPWVNNCVNFTNYKYFVLFLGYGLIYCIFVAAVSAQYFIQFWTASDKDMSNLHIVFLFFAGIMFSISLVSLFGYHLYLTSVNRSTLESFRAPIFRSGPDKDGFSLGKQGNYQEVFGDNCSKWFVPIFSSFGDGVTYPTRITHEEVVNYHSTDDKDQSSASVGDRHNSVQPSFGDGVNFPVRTVDEDYDTLLGERQRWMEEGEADSHGEAQGFVNEGHTTRM